MNVGDVLTVHDVKAFWAFSEVGSTRFGVHYPTELPASLYRHISDGGSFDDIDDAGRKRLAAALLVGRNEDFAASVDPHSNYRLEQWEKTKLAQTLVLPTFGMTSDGANLPYWFFYFGRPSVKDGKPDPADPRLVALSLTRAAVRADVAAIAIGTGPHLLLEGYLRSVLFMRDASHDELFPVWVPQHEANDGSDQTSA